MSKADLWQKYSRCPSEENKQELVLAYLDMVKHISGRLSVKLPPILNREDLESCGILGLLDAVEKYDPLMNVEFEHFARHRIRGAMYDEIRKANWIPRSTWQKLNNLYSKKEKLEQLKGRSISVQELAGELGVSLQELHDLNNHLTKLGSLSLHSPPNEELDENLSFIDLLPDPSAPDPLQEVCDNDEKDTLVAAVKSLNERDQLILALYYQEELTLKEIGQVLEISESRVCQLHKRAIGKLRRQIKGKNKSCC